MSAPDTPGGAGPESGTRERLQRISRHFLSEEGAMRHIAVLADPDEPRHLLPDGLARTLAGHGRSVIVVDTAAGLVSLIRPDPAAGARHHDLDAARLMGSLRADHPGDVVLVRAPHADAAPASCDLVLLAVPVHSRGMRSAYSRLKALAQNDPRPPIGVTITAAQDRDEAAAAFARFSGAAQRFLDIRVTSYSYVAAATARDRSAIAASLDNIARLLLEDRDAASRPARGNGNPQAQPRNLYTKGQT